MPNRNLDHAYNWQLWGYDIGSQDRQPYAVIQCQHLMRNDKGRVDTICRAHDSPQRPSMTPLAEETDFDPENVQESILTAVVVGVLPSSGSIKGDEEKKHSQKDTLKQPSHAPKNSSVEQLSDPETLHYDPKALRVVAPRGRSTASFYALTSQDPHTKLCEGIALNGEEVFFFREFRDDSLGAHADRKKLWSAKVREKLQKEHILKQRESRAAALTNTTVSRERNFAAEVFSFVYVNAS